MKIKGILETALYCDDLEAARTFYTDVLGLVETDSIEGRHVFFTCGDSKLLIFNPQETIKPSESDLPIPTHGTTGHGHVCFRASLSEIDDWKSKLEAAGVAIKQYFSWPNGARSLYFRDPTGNSLEFAEPVLWGFSA